MRIHAKLCHLGKRCVTQVATSLAWVGTLKIECVWLIVQKRVKAVIRPHTRGVLNKAVREAENLVVRTESHRVATLIPSQVVFNQIDVLIHEVYARRIFSAKIHCHIFSSVFTLHVCDIHRRALVVDVAVVADAIIRHTQFVAPIVAEA